MKTILLSLYVYILFLSSGKTTVYPFDEEIPGHDIVLQSVVREENMVHTDELQSMPNSSAFVIQQDNELARQKQLMLTGFFSIVRSAAIVNFVNSKDDNSFSTALKFVAFAHAAYGAVLIIEPLSMYCRQKNAETPLPLSIKNESDMSYYKNGALTGVSACISGVEGILFSFAAPDDPLAPLAIFLGAEQSLFGVAASAYSVYSMCKKVSIFEKYLSRYDAGLSLEELDSLNEKKLERGRLQLSLILAVWHIARGASTYYLQSAMPSEFESGLLISFGSLELLFGICALNDPIKGLYFYLNNIDNIGNLDQRMRNYYILRSLGLILMSPVNIIYTLGVPDAKTKWIIGGSIIAVIVGVLSGWNPTCDYFEAHKWKCKRRDM